MTQDPQDAQNSPENGSQEASGANPVDLVAVFRLGVERGVALYGQGEQVAHAVSLSIMPGPQGQPVPVMIVVLSIPSPVLGQRCMVTNIVQDIHAPMEPIVDMVGQMLEKARSDRSAALAQVNGHGDHGLGSPLTLP